MQEVGKRRLVVGSGICKLSTWLAKDDDCQTALTVRGCLETGKFCRRQHWPADWRETSFVGETADFSYEWIGVVELGAVSGLKPLRRRMLEELERRLSFASTSMCSELA